MILSLHPIKHNLSSQLLTAIEVRGFSGYREGYKRVTKRATWAISRLSVAWAIREVNEAYEDIRIAIGSCTPMPFRPKKIEESLKGVVKNDQTIQAAIEEILEEIKAFPVYGHHLYIKYR